MFIGRVGGLQTLRLTGLCSAKPNIHLQHNVQEFFKVCHLACTCSLVGQASFVPSYESAMLCAQLRRLCFVLLRALPHFCTSFDAWKECSNLLEHGSSCVVFGVPAGISFV